MENKTDKGVALFDLDQTLIPWDTQLLFVNWVIKHEPWRVVYLLVFVPFSLLAKVIGTEGMKRVFLTYLLGMQRDELDALVDSFVAEVIPNQCYPSMLEELEKQKQMGRLTILMTASPAFYGEKIGKALGFDIAIGTDVDLGETVGLFPEIIDGNNKGENKLKRLYDRAPEVLSCLPIEDSKAFSDSHADLPMLYACEEAMIVNPTTKLLEVGEHEGWELVRPDRPTQHSKFRFAIACAKQALGLWRA